MAYNWNKERAEARIETRLGEVKYIEIKEYVRNTDLRNLPRATAYRVNGVHIYVDILNVAEILDTTSDEGVTSHRRALRFLNLHYRAVRRILSSVDVIEVDFHNQRLHAVVAKPYADEAARVHRGIAVAQLIIDVLQQTGDESEDIPAAVVRVGIDTGTTLAVNNGRRGHSEPLFLGEAANHAAKRASGGDVPGIFLTNTARLAIDLDTVDSEDEASLTKREIETSEKKADLQLTAGGVVKKWREDLESNPISRFEFSGHTPPFRNLDIELLSPSNSRRQDAVSVYADIDGFTAYVSSRVDDEDMARDVVRVLHVLRSELDAVLDTDFGGRKIRFIGDCIHGVLAEGTAQTTDHEESVRIATLCAGGLRSSFELAIDVLEESGIDARELGLAVGFELGPLSVTRLGMKGSMVRCAIGRNVLASENEQTRSSGAESAIGTSAYNKATDAVRSVFGSTRKRANLDYRTAVDELKSAGGTRRSSASLTQSTASTSLLRPATAAPALAFPAYNAAPTKPRGFA